MVEAEHQHIGNDKPEGEYHGGRKSIQHKNFGRHEGGAPDGNRDECHKMIQTVTVVIHG